MYIIYNKAVNPPSKKTSDFTLGVKVYSLDEKKVVSFIEIPINQNDIDSINSCFIDSDDTLIIFAVTQKGLKEIRAYDFMKNTSDLIDTVCAFPGKVETVELDSGYDLNEYFYSGLQIGNIKYVYYCSISNLYIYKSTNRKSYEPVERIPLSSGRLFLPVYNKSNYSKEAPFLANSHGKNEVALPENIRLSLLLSVQSIQDREPSRRTRLRIS